MGKMERDKKKWKVRHKHLLNMLPQNDGFNHLIN